MALVREVVEAGNKMSLKEDEILWTERALEKLKNDEKFYAPIDFEFVGNKRSSRRLYVNADEIKIILQNRLTQYRREFEKLKLEFNKVATKM